MKILKTTFIVFFLSSFLYAQVNGFIVADTPGAYNSYWHTSITLTNFSEQVVKIPFVLYLSSGTSFKFEIEIKEKSSMSKLLIDILKDSGIELENFFGWVEVDLSNIPKEFSGFAVMYTPDPNAGEGGIFAEITPMFFSNETEFLLYPLTPCGKDAKEPMALGGAVWRTNVGFINTSLKNTTVELECYDADGTFLVHTSFGLNPKEIKQLNDVKRPEIWNLPCELIKEPVICFGSSSDPEAFIYAYGANNNNVNNFPIYISPQ